MCNVPLNSHIIHSKFGKGVLPAKFYIHVDVVNGGEEAHTYWLFEVIKLTFLTIIILI